MHVKLPQVCSSSKYRQSEGGRYLGVIRFVVHVKSPTSTDLIYKTIKYKTKNHRKENWVEELDHKWMYVDFLIEYTCVFFVFFSYSFAY